jgi:hypothetical protein
MAIEDLLAGKSPSLVFRDYLADNSSRTNADAAGWFIDRFPDVESSVVHVIWNLKTSTREVGLDDAYFDDEIRRYLAAAGYL